MEKDGNGVLDEVRCRYVAFEEAMDKIESILEGADTATASSFLSQTYFLTSLESIIMEQFSRIVSGKKKQLHVIESNIIFKKRLATQVSTIQKPLTKAPSKPSVSSTMHLIHVLNSICHESAIELTSASSAASKMRSIVSLSSIRLRLPEAISLDALADLDSLREQEHVTSGWNPIDVNPKTLKLIRTEPGRDQNGGSTLSFNYPWGLCVHPTKGLIYVADSSNNKIQVLDRDLNPVKIIQKNQKHQFNFVTDIRFSMDGTLGVVVDKGSAALYFLNENDDIIGVIQSSEDEGMGGVKKIKNPRCVAFDLDNNFYVTDSQTNMIFKFSKSGDLIFSIPFASITKTNNHPWSIMVSDENQVYVLAQSGNTVFVLESTGEFVREMKIEATVDWNYMTQSHKGGFCVASNDDNRIDFYTRHGDLEHTIETNEPFGIEFDEHGRFFVAHRGNHSISFYEASA